MDLSGCTAYDEGRADAERGRIVFLHDHPEGVREICTEAPCANDYAYHAEPNVRAAYLIGHCATWGEGHYVVEE